MSIKGKVNKKSCAVCGCKLFYVYESSTQLMLMIRCVDCENTHTQNTDYVQKEEAT